MPKLATIPLTIHPDAAAFLARIGQERELELILDHIRATIPHLRALHVSYYDFPETGSLNLTIEAHCKPGPDEHDRVDKGFNRWMVENFPPEVNRNFTLITDHHTDEG